MKNRLRVKTFVMLGEMAYKGLEIMDKACAEIYLLIYPFIEEEIMLEAHVFIQDGDGMCLSYESKERRRGVQNTPLDFIIDLINSTDRKLTEEDLLSISI